ncbi:MAG: HAD-IB family phosphatase [Desulfurococcaceae archaeon]|nr:HAD-IB family phosphatase [Sulfolobales archaeon]MDW8170010.1 HAD-IB family phosphatase [Desulfurococcaceae archaeon]
MKGLVIFDCDGVLTEDDSSWQLLHKYFGSSDSHVAELYKKNIISYLDWMKIDIILMIKSWGRPIARRLVEEILSKTKVRPESYAVFKMLKQYDFIVGIISSGIDILVKRICRDVGADICLYNELLFINDELVPGGKSWVPLLEKPYIVNSIARSLGIGMERVAYVGDSEWDEEVFKVVGLPIAMNTCSNCFNARSYVNNLWEVVDIVKEHFSKF